MQNGSRLEYALRVANAPGNLDNIALAGVYGHVVRNTGAVNFYQKNRAGREGFRFGVDAAWNDSLIRASVTPLAPVFGSEPWTVNPGNYLVYRFDGNLSADLDMTHGDQRFAIHTVPETDSLRGIRLDIAGLNIGGALAMLPSAPPVGGVLGAAVTLNTGADSLAVRGDVSVAGLSYDKQRFGDVGLGVRYAQGREQQADVRLTLDGADVLTARGDYRKERESPLDLTASIPGFPLQRADVFLPADMLRLSGILSGKLHAGGTPQRLQLNGGLQFAQTEVRVPMIGTSFRLSSDTIRIDDSRVLFDDFAVTAPNKSPLTIGGYVDLTDFGRITADIALRASDFQFVNVARKEGTDVYGKAYLDLDATAKGPLDELVVRGSVALLKNTDINYVMQDSPMDVKERPQNIVTFVSFRDMDNQSFAEATPTVRIGGMDILLNVDINDDVQAAVDLSADGSNRIDLQGGGNLTFTMNPLGDVSLSGKYVLSGGTVRYNPPVISQKIFKITPDSYVDWVGNVADPAFNITAVETVRASVSADGQDSRSVNFNISINIRNTLNDLEVSFGLSAPEDLTMQNQLNSLTAEQRANQAMNLLIYNTYTGPGTTAKVSTENPLNIVHTERAEPVGAEQPEGRGPQLRHRLLRRGRPERPADRLFVPAVQKSLQQPRARRHRGQVQHRRRPVAEPEGEPDRRHFARIHADQTRQHVSEGLPPHRLRKHPRRRDHRDGRGLRHPEETAPAGRPVQTDASQSGKGKTKTKRVRCASEIAAYSSAPHCSRRPVPRPGVWERTKSCTRELGRSGSNPIRASCSPQRPNRP